MFEAFSNHHISKLSGLKTAIDLRDAAEDDSCMLELQMLQTELSSLQSKLILIKSRDEQRKKKLTELKEIDEKASTAVKKISYTVNNIPSRLPKPNKPSQEVPISSQPPLSLQNQPTTASNRSNISTASSVTSKPRSSNHLPNSANSRSTVENTYYPELEFLTTDEFELVPKYLKGRLSYDQVNKFIESMNKSYMAKYKLMKQKKSSMNDVNRKRYEAFKSQETKETKGCYFIVDQDMKEFGGLKIDKVANSILTILRHCGRCREVRGGRLTRYVYIESY